MNQIQRIAIAAFTGIAMSHGMAIAANPTATSTEQQPAATPSEATKPRLPAAADTHRAGPTQSQTGSGDVRDVPPTLKDGARPVDNARPGQPGVDGATKPGQATDTAPATSGARQRSDGPASPKQH